MAAAAARRAPSPLLLARGAFSLPCSRSLTTLLPLHLARAYSSPPPGDAWDRPYTRELAAYPAPWTRANKFWPTVGRVNDTHGDRVLICTCPSVEEYR